MTAPHLTFLTGASRGMGLAMPGSCCVQGMTLCAFRGAPMTR